MTIHEGDCLAVMREVEDEAFDLVYVDPPFFTQKTHRLSPRSRDREFAFSDLWADHADYSGFLLERLEEAKRVLRSNGSLYFHCDRNAAHIARGLLDRVFGSGNFRAEIIWHYRRWSNSKRGLLPSHQNILYYTKSDDFVFNQEYGEYSPSTNVDQIMQKRVRDASGKTIYARDAAGGTLASGPKKGVPLGDVWDIPYLNPKANERVGYPTQKPVLLLERIMRLSTNEGASVLDPFCGSGTTLVAAHLLNRRAVGIDISSDAVALARSRLCAPTRTESALLEKGRESYRLASDDLLSLLMGIDYVPVHRNNGIDAILKQEIEGRPVVLRIQRSCESVAEAANALVRAGRARNAAKLLLVVTNRAALPELIDSIPHDVELIESPAEQIRAGLCPYAPPSASSGRIEP